MNFPEFSESKGILKIGRSEVCEWGGVALGRTLKSRLRVYIYRLGQFSSPTFTTTPHQTHTSDRPIFKISFDSENSGKLMRHSVAISLIFAS